MATDPFHTTIKQYLDNRAATDELFAAKYNNPKKSIQECCAYIQGEAYAQAIDGRAILSDDTVYGMAVHYYDEEDITIRKAPGCGTKSPQPKLSKEKKQALQEQAEREYKAQVAANLKQKEIERKAAAKEKAKVKREKEHTLFANTLFD